MATQDKNFKVKNGIDAAGSSTFDGNVTFNNTITAGGNVGSNGEVLISTGNGVAWSAATSGGLTFYYADSAPVQLGGFSEGDQWFNSSNGVLYTWIEDGVDLGQWVDTRASGYFGTQGVQGPQGATGPSGRTILYGTVDPTTEGSNDDFYINVSTSKLFGPKLSGTWPAGVNLIGPQGATGATGNTGPRNIAILAPTASENITLFFTTQALTISKIAHVIRGGTSVTFTIRHASTRSAAGTEVVTGGTVANSTTGATVTSFNSASIPANSWVWVTTSAVAGTVNELSVSVEF